MGALDWYNEAIKQTKENRTCRLFWELRTECAHRQMIEPKPIIAVSLTAKKTDIKIEGFFITYFEGKMKKYRDYGNKNLIDLAEEHMCIIRSIVEEAVEKFGFKERPLKNFHTRPGYIKIEAKARAMNFMMQKMIEKQNKQ